MVSYLVKGLLSASALANAQEFPTFEAFVQMQSRSYQMGSTEYSERESLYQQRKADAEVHNRQEGRLWTAGVNKLWDWTEAELKTLRGWDGAMQPEGGGSGSRSVRRHSAFLQQDLPTEKSWANLATSQHIRNQGDCGSCWAIAASTVLEGHAEIATGTLALSLRSRSWSALQTHAIVEVMEAARVQLPSSPWSTSLRMAAGRQTRCHTPLRMLLAQVQAQPLLWRRL